MVSKIKLLSLKRVVFAKKKKENKKTTTNKHNIKSISRHKIDIFIILSLIISSINIIIVIFFNITVVVIHIIIIFICFAKTSYYTMIVNDITILGWLSYSFFSRLQMPSSTISLAIGYWKSVNIVLDRRRQTA